MSELPYEVVKSHFTLPFELYPFQQDIVNVLSPLPRAGYYAQPGTGKTAMSTASALYKKLKGTSEVAVVTMPPILIKTWARWLARIPGIKVTQYLGTPKARAAIKLDGDFILMSIQIFKIDHVRIMAELGHKPRVLIVDEATAIKSVASDNYKKTREFADDQELMLLTGTPLSSPADAYAYCKLIAPTIYRNLRTFENVHVEERDFFNKPTKWQNLDLLADNMRVNAVRVYKRDVLKDLPPITYTPIFYDLSPDHARLYKRLADDQVLKLKDGGKIDATQATALYHALQQIIINFDVFAQDDTLLSAGYDIIEEVMDEIAGGKLVIFASYRMTNRGLVKRLAKYNAVAAYGDLTSVQQARNIEQFISDPACRILIAQPISAGYGVDGLQAVCSDALFLEEPVVPRDFEQACDRLSREGQRHGVNVRIAIALKTCQVRLHNNLLAKDALVNSVQGSYQDLRDAIFGN